MAKKKGKIGTKHGKGRGPTTKMTSVTGNTKYGAHAAGGVPLTGGSKHK